MQQTQQPNDKTQKSVFTGTLTLKDTELDRMNYFTYDRIKTESKSISDLLDQLIVSGLNCEEIIVTIKQIKPDGGLSYLGSFRGALSIQQDNNGLDYFVGESPLGYYLSTITGSEVLVVIEHPELLGLEDVQDGQQTSVRS